MSRFTMRKLAAAGLGAALIGSGLTVGLGAGVASADPAAECNATTTFSGSQGLTLTQTVTPAKVQPGGKVTYTTKVSRSTAVGWNLAEIGVFHPAGFALNEGASTVNAWHVVGGQKSESVNMQNDAAKGLYWTKSGTVTGWDMNGGHYAELSTTFTVPQDAKVGSAHQAGVQAKPVAWNSQEWPVTGACVTIREKNAVEAGAGSLEGLGLGSINSGSSQIFGSLTDPQGSMTDVIGGILGNVLGNMS